MRKIERKEERDGEREMGENKERERDEIVKGGRREKKNVCFFLVKYPFCL